MENRVRGLREDQWQQVRKRWESGASEASLAREFGVDRETVRRRRRREAWMPQATPQLGQHEAKAIHQRATAEVIDMATRQVVDAAISDGTVSKITQDMKRGLDRHDAIVEQMLDVAEFTMRKAMERSFERGEAAQIRDAVLTAALAVDKSREIKGKKPGDLSVDADRKSGPPDIVRLVVVDKHSGEFCPACHPNRLPASLRDVSHPHSYIKGECDEAREASDGS